MNRRLFFGIGRVLGIVGGAWGLFATALIFNLPMYRVVEMSGTATETLPPQTLLQQGQLEPVTLFFFAAMIGLSVVTLGVSLVASTDPRLAGLVVLVASILLLFGSFISGFSVGPFYLPGALFAFLAGILILFPSA